jgi:hypothetical protein
LPTVMPLVGLILKSAGSRIPWDEHLKATEKEMERLAKSLPVWAWAKDVAGFGPKGLAIIVGEAGDLWNYPRREHLWKRLGLAVINGERQRKKSDLEEVRAHGYNPQRRAESWTLADSLFKHQWAGEASAYRKALKEQAGKDYDSKTKLDDLREIAHGLGIFAAAYATGPYGEVYEAAKMKARDKDWKDKHADNHARRLMWKAVVKDLRKAWKRLTPTNASQSGPKRLVAQSDYVKNTVLASTEKLAALVHADQAENSARRPMTKPPARSALKTTPHVVKRLTPFRPKDRVSQDDVDNFHTE